MANEAMGTCTATFGRGHRVPHKRRRTCPDWQPIAPAEPTAGILNNLAGVFGTWPGDETDEELLGALGEIRNPAEPVASGDARTQHNYEYCMNLYVRSLEARIAEMDAQLAEMTKQKEEDAQQYDHGITVEKQRAESAEASLAEMTEEKKRQWVSLDRALNYEVARWKADHTAMATERNQWDEERDRDAIVVRDMVNQLATERQRVCEETNNLQEALNSAEQTGMTMLQWLALKNAVKNAVLALAREKEGK